MAPIIKESAQFLGPSGPALEKTHSAKEDAQEAIKEFRYYKNRYFDAPKS